MIGLDTETELVSDAAPVPPLVCAQLAIGDTSVVLHHADPDTVGMLSEALDETLALANAPFDGAVICEYAPQLEPKWWQALKDGRIVDVLTRERFIDIASPRGLRPANFYGLAAVVKRWCGVELDKTGASPRKHYGDLKDTPLSWWPADAVRYAEDDARYTLRAAEHQIGYAAHFEAQHGVPLFADAANQARAHWALHLGSLHGMHTDQARVTELLRLIDARMAQHRELLERVGLIVGGTKKQKPLQAMLEAAGATRRTASGKALAADSETMELLELPDDHPLHTYRQYASLEKLKSTYVMNFLGKDLVRPYYTELVSNGRCSAAGDLRQNMPQQWRIKRLLDIDWGVRECLVPAPGNVFVIADYSKAELVAWAQVLIELFGWDAPTAELARALNDGRDVHDELLREMGGGERTMAKIGNFSFMGGGGVERLISETLGKFGIRLDHAAVTSMREAWRRRWAGGWYFGWIEDQMVDGKMNFVHSSGRVACGLGFTDACNYPFSGRAADAEKDAAWRLAVEMYTEPDSPLYGARMPLMVHDEYILECPREHAERVGVRLVEVMKSTFLDWCPDVPIEVEAHVEERYSK